MRQIQKAADQALANAGMTIKDIDCLCSGMTGADWSHEYAYLEKNIGMLFPNLKIKVVNDCIICMRAGTNKRYGGVAAAGTGYNCALINEAGEELIFGYYIADEDSGGHALGKQMLKAVINADAELGEKTTLTEALLTYTGHNSTIDFMKDYFAGTIRLESKNLVPLIFKVSAQGDKVATDLLRITGRNYAKYINTGMCRLNMCGETFELVLNGGIFKNKNPVLINAFTESVLSCNPDVHIVNAVMEPVCGAVIIGLEMIFCSVNTKMFKILEQSANGKIGGRLISKEAVK
jgi:N-acetylglucosamine kinase-like BadF-type ATPase